MARSAGDRGRTPPGARAGSVAPAAGAAPGARTPGPKERARAWDELAVEAGRCTACPLHRDATQAVVGEGPLDARLVLVGEQPGDREDVAGHPFVGPAGRLLDRALDAAGIQREAAYLTNVVKHVKFEWTGQVRLHKKPSSSEVTACRPWLDAELALVQPELVVVLGATAARALLGSRFRVTRGRGEVLRRAGLPPLLATVHPSSVLRTDDRDAAFAGLVADLEVAASVISST